MDPFPELEGEDVGAQGDSDQELGECKKRHIDIKEKGKGRPYRSSTSDHIRSPQKPGNRCETAAAAVAIFTPAHTLSHNDGSEQSAERGADELQLTQVVNRVDYHPGADGNQQNV